VLWATQGLCAKKKPPLHPVNLNTATAAELQQVPGIGQATVDKILQARKAYGRFKSVDDLQAVQGIGPKRLEKMRKYRTVNAPPQAKKPAYKPPPSKAKPTAVPEKPADFADDDEEEP
jgi:competence ComEA-like helix-hairpin-helix protein